MDAGRYRLEIEDDPTGPDDVVPWSWRLHSVGLGSEIAHGYERTRDEAVAAAKRWILFQRAKDVVAPEMETIVLDENGDPIPQSLAVAR